MTSTPALAASAESPAQRFDALDGLRGLAAIAVMLLHYTEHNDLRWLSNAWVAVDLFFVLSGFVIAHSYAHRVALGLRLTQFVALRWMRLGPLYLLGLMLGLAAILATPKIESAMTPVSAQDVIRAVLLGLVWLPDLNDVAWPFAGDTVRGAIFPLNIPAWSLFFEATVNLMFFFYVRRMGRAASGVWVTLAWVLFVVVTWRSHIFNPGWSSYKLAIGLGVLRVTAEFFLGALIWQQGWHRRWQVPHRKFAAMAVAVCCLWTFASTGSAAAFANTLLGVPLTIVLLAGVEVRGATKRACRMLGEVSYPLYIVHYPLFQLGFVLFNLRRIPSVLQVLSMALLALGLAAMLSVLDRRVRVRLSAMRRTPRSSAT